MKKSIPLLILLIVILEAVSCSKALNNWVYIRAELSDFASPGDSLAGLVMARNFENAAYQSQGSNPYAFIYDRQENMDAIVAAADTYYASVKDTVTAHYSLTLKKILSTTAMEEKDKLKLRLSSYTF